MSEQEPKILDRLSPEEGDHEARKEISIQLFLLDQVAKRIREAIVLKR